MSAAPPPELSVKYVWSPAGDAELALHILRAHPDLHVVVGRERLVRTLRALPGAGVLGLVFAFVIVRSSHPETLRFALLAGALVGIPFVLYSTGSGPWAKFRASVRQMADGRLPHAETTELRTVDIRVHQDGLSIDQPNMQALIRWASFERVIRLPNHLAVIYAGSVQGVFIPLAAFGSDDVARTWESLLRERIETPSSPAVLLVRQELAHVGLRCVRCTYDLSGGPTLRCPECGEPMTLLAARLRRFRNMSIVAQVLGNRVIKSKEIDIRVPRG